ncbi:hypothetical protein [Micromonospora sp. NPDC049799]|uniref:hypothetical protein n=1 Tax=Micromonospora sp. NPDC049799 TaxID=3154741 RepID=UPI0033DCAB25
MILAVSLASLVQGGPAAADAANKGGDFVPVNTVLLDTRNGTGGVTGARPAGDTATVTALGVGGVPSTGVRALLLDVTAISPTAATYLTVFPKDATRPTASSLNAAKGEVLTNSVVVPVDSSGQLSVYNLAGSTHVKLDVQGYFTTGTTGAGGAFVPVDHARVVDTRSGLGTTTGPIAANGSRTVTLTGGVIPAGASAALVDVVVTGATTVSFLNVATAGQATAVTSLDYQVGTTSMGMSVKLPADGKVVLTNKGTGTVHALVTVQGYFTATPTTGAGLRTVPATRLLDTRTAGSKTPVPANGTVDVAVGGVNGLPTRGIAGAVLNLTAVGPTSTGHFTVWPLGATPAVASVTNFSTGQIARSSLAVARVGAEGKIRIKNNSSGTVHLLVDLQGWFADPVQELPTVPFTRMSVLQGEPDGSTVRKITLAYTDNVGVLRVGTVDPGAWNDVAWAPISGQEAYTGTPSLHQRTDKGIQVAAQNIDTDIWSANESTEPDYLWPAPTSLGGSMAGPPTGLRVSTGKDVLFAVDTDGRLWQYRELTGPPTWTSLGDVDLVGQVSVVDDDEAYRLIATTTAGTVKTALYYADGSLSGWTDLGGNVTGTPAAVWQPGNRTRIVARRADGAIVTKAETSTTTWTGEWERIGDFTAAGSPAIILDPELSRLAVVARGHDDEIHQVFETATGSATWGQWWVLNPDPVGTPENAATDPAVAKVSTGTSQTYVIVFRNRNGAFRLYSRQLSPGDGQGLAGAQVSYAGRTLPAPPAS